MPACRIDPNSSLYPRLKPKWIKDLNIKPDTLNLIIEQKVVNSLEPIGTGNNFLSRTPIPLALRSTINK